MPSINKTLPSSGKAATVSCQRKSFPNAFGHSRNLPQIDKFLQEKYQTIKDQRKRDIYHQFVCFCAKAKIPERQIPSYKTFIGEMKKLSGN